MSLIAGLAYLVATAQHTLIEAIQLRLPAVKAWGGWVLVGVGVWFMVLALFARFFARYFPV